MMEDEEESEEEKGRIAVSYVEIWSCKRRGMACEKEPAHLADRAVVWMLLNGPSRWSCDSPGETAGPSTWAGLGGGGGGALGRACITLEAGSSSAAKKSSIMQKAPPLPPGTRHPTPSVRPIQSPEGGLASERLAALPVCLFVAKRATASSGRPLHTVQTMER